MTKYLFYVAFLAIAASGCDSVEFKKTKGGMPYKVWSSKKNGKKAEEGKFIKVHYEQKVNDSVLFSTRSGIPAYFQVKGPEESYHITEVIHTLKEGDSVIAVQSADTFFRRDPNMATQTTFKKGDKFITTLTIIKVFDRADDYMQDEQKEIQKMVANEPEAVKQYLKKNNVNDATQTRSGAFVQVLTPGTGPQVDSGKYVTVMYTGRTFAGKVFDSNQDPSFGHTEPLGFVVGAQQMLVGFDEGVRALKVGSKARLYLPSMTAYGPKGNMPKIMPFENIVFDVQVVDIADKTPPPPPMPQGQNPADPH
jgi:FKBP-type peptidyl-prolyl cis-trans isomerase FkpA